MICTGCRTRTHDECLNKIKKTKTHCDCQCKTGVFLPQETCPHLRWENRYEPCPTCGTASAESQGPLPEESES